MEKNHANKGINSLHKQLNDNSQQINEVIP